jgi:hypothetical protein
MSITYDVLNISTTEVATNVHTLARTDLKIQSQVKGSDGSVETIYRLMTSDEDRPLSIRVGIYPKTGSQNISVAIETGFTGVDSEGLMVTDGRIRATLALQIPKANGLGNTADVLALIGNLYSMFYDGLTSGDPNTNVLSLFAQGIAEIDA